ncbi:MAG: hypothetical protein JAY64_12995 [Candidatus Thiodiazotropha weberae]|nr:hypothetical protein [Candidatus Thiodiazotropha lotti]MCW4212069.1 hypothetical protein [Candidatus Thiodiazotropha lotti]
MILPIRTLIPLLLPMLLSIDPAFARDIGPEDYERSRWHPIHFKPNIDNAKDEQCLSCHQEILERKVLNQSPAGITSTGFDTRLKPLSK